MKNKVAITIVFLFLFSELKAQNYWKPITSNTTSNLYSISFGDAQTGYICGSDSLLLKTSNGGKTWNRVNVKGINFKYERDLIDVKFVSPLVGYIIQSNHKNTMYQGTLLKTIDGGLNWSPSSNTNIAPVKIFYFNEDNGFQIGSAYFQGKMVGKQVKGNWQNVQSFSWDPSETIRAIDFYDTLTGVIGGDSGYVYRTFDGGVKWDTVRAAYRNPILSLRYISKNIILGSTGSIGNFGTEIYSNNDGKTWQERGSSFTRYHPEIREIIKSRRDSIIRVGESNRYGFIEWMTGTNDFDTFFANRPLNSATMKNDSIAFIVGDSGTILCNGIYETLHTSQLEKAIKSLVFPNPVSQILTIQSESYFGFQLYDPLGKLIESGKNCAFTHQMNLTGNTEGIYYLKINYGNQTEVHKIFIQH